MAHHRDAGRDEPRDELGVDSAPPSSLTDWQPPSFISRPAFSMPCSSDAWYAHERHVADDVRPPHAAHDRAAVVDHLVERDGERRVVALDDHAERIADEQHVGAGFVEEPRERGVVGGEHGDLLAALLHLPQGVDGDALRLHSAPPFFCKVVRFRSHAPDHPATRFGRPLTWNATTASAPPGITWSSGHVVSLGSCPRASAIA